MRIDYSARVQDAAEEHCFGRFDVEVGGFLIGTIDDSGTHIRHAHAALAAQSAQANLTFTHEVWDEVLPLLETTYKGQAIVGWYHSHPGFGVFLSDYDVFIQENFFNSPGQVALVIDPLAGAYGFLTAANGKAIEQKLGTTKRAALGAQETDKADLLAPPGQRPRRLPAVIAAVVAAVVAGAFGWFVGSVQGQSAASDAARAQVGALQAQVIDLQARLDTAPSPSPTESVTPSPAPSPSESVTPSPSPSAPGAVPGDRVTIGHRYVVAPGDSYWRLASRFLGSGLKWQEIVAANPGIDPMTIVPGQRIVIPIEGTLTSVAGGAS